MTQKIYCFVNGGNRDWYPVLAMCEDGHVLGSHLSSSVAYAKHDIGITSDWRGLHETYKEHCPDGYELVWVDEEDIKDHEGLMEAYRLNQEIAANALTVS